MPGNKNSGYRGARTNKSSGNQYASGSYLWKPEATPEQKAMWAERHRVQKLVKDYPNNRVTEKEGPKRPRGRPVGWKSPHPPKPPKPPKKRAYKPKPKPPKPPKPPPSPELLEARRLRNNAKALAALHAFRNNFVGPPKPPGPPPLRWSEYDPRLDAPLDPLARPGLGLHSSLRIPVRVNLTELGNKVVKNTAFDTLFDDLQSFHDDPYGFVMWAFPWGEPGTPLEDMTGPEEWQRDQMLRISERLREGGLEGCVIEEDTSSGHGIGKSCQVAWMILWAISTFEDTRGVITANTDAQLRTKTWAELAKWYELFIAKAFFKLTATALYLAGDPVREKKWRIDQAPWSKENTEAFAGMHNLGKRILVIFDEAAAIDDHIWEVTEGALTDARTQIIWLRYGNPTRTSGAFFKRCTQGKRNTFTRVDSRTVSFSNKSQIRAWVDDYGEDSDFVRVRVKGQFPRAGYANFISPELVMAARARKLDPVVYRSYPKILAVDPARFGDDMSVITLRQGLRVHWQVSLSGFDGPDLASRIFEIVRKESPISCIVYDAIGNGADLDSALRRMNGLPPLMAVQWGMPARDAKMYFNQRSEAWGTLRDALEHCQIPDDDELSDQLTSLDYGYSATFQIQLQSKKDQKKNGSKSPDKADSLALSHLPDLIDRKTVLAKVRPTGQRRKVIWSR